MPALPPLAVEQLPDGVYLSLAEEVYFGQDRLGSSDDIKLHKRKQGWWWSSRFCPDSVAGAERGPDDVVKEATRQRELVFGSALHALVLEGAWAYRDRFAIAPDPRDFKGLITTATEAEREIRAAGFDLQGHSKWRASDWYQAVRVNMPDRPIWDDIWAAFERKRRRPNGELMAWITAIEDRQLQLMQSMVLEDPKVAEIMGHNSPYPALAEVSVLYTDRYGVKRRARFDKVVPNFTGDLKSLGNWQARELAFGIDDHIKQQGHDVQLAGYQDARKIMNGMLAMGEHHLHGGTPEQRAHLLAMVKRRLPWEWCWIYFQKPETTKGMAPVIFPVWEDWRGPYHVQGYRKLVRARELWRDCVEKFGLGDIPAADGSPSRPWTRVEPLHFTNEDYARETAQPWIFRRPFDEEAAVEGEEEDLIQ